MTVAGKRINLSQLADEPPLADARVPAFAESTPRSAPVGHIAPNPLNTRRIHANPAKVSAIADSMRVHGQLQPCAVVTRSAFLGAFPEHETAIGDAIFVQVTGGRRHAAAIQAGRSTLDITVKNDLADSRAKFVSATAAENIDREDLDPIEEARAVELIVKECGSGKAAAEQLSRTPPWVTQRLNLLKLIPELQAALSAGEMPLREVRDLHKRTPAEQMQALEEWRARTTSPAESDDATDEQEQSRPEPRPRPSPVASAIRRLGGTPVKIAESLRAELAPDDLRDLVTLLTKDL